jgi:hypothetical protein
LGGNGRNNFQKNSEKTRLKCSTILCEGWFDDIYHTHARQLYLHFAENSVTAAVVVIVGKNQVTGVVVLNCNADGGVIGRTGFTHIRASLWFLRYSYL